MLADSGPDDADIKAELESEQTEKPEVEADVKTEKQTVEEVDQLDLDEIDESSCHSWTEPVLSGKQKKEVLRFSTNQHSASHFYYYSVALSVQSGFSQFNLAVDEKPIPGSGRTTPDHEIQPPTKRGRGTDGSFRTAKNNTKRDFTHKNRKPKIVERETDEKTLQRRQVHNDKIELSKPISSKKQIDYGKVTVDYEEYLNAIPKSERKHFHPRTPDKFQKMSRRGFDSQIKTWKINIHNWQNLGPKKGTHSMHVL